MILPYVATVLLALATVYSAIVSFRQKPEGAKPSWIFPDGTGRTARIFIGLATVVLLLGVVARFSLSVQTSAPRSVRFLIPEAYSGWVRIEFEVAGAPALPVEGGQLVLRIPPSGLVQTSSAEQYGWVKENYAFYSNSGLRPISNSGPGRLIWGKINGEATNSSGERKYEEFFVGTEKQFREQLEPEKPKTSPEDGHLPN